MDTEATQTAPTPEEAQPQAPLRDGLIIAVFKSGRQVVGFPIPFVGQIETLEEKSQQALLAALYQFHRLVQREQEVTHSRDMEALRTALAAAQAALAQARANAPMSPEQPGPP